jgi:hypothetical protein
MATRQQCTFFLLRYVPDAVKNEFVNVGVVLLPAAGTAELRFTHDWSRVRCLDPQADLALLEGIGSELQDKLRDAGPERESMVRKIQDSFSNTIQASDLTACLAESPAAEADELARLYLERPLRGPSREMSTRQMVLQRMRGEFERAAVWGLMSKNIAVAQYTRSGDPLKIDCGYSAAGMVKMFHSLALQTDINSAKVLAFSFPSLAEGIRRAEGARAQLTAIVEDDLERNDDAVGFALETLAQQAIVVASLDQLPGIAAAAARELGVI